MELISVKILVMTLSGFIRVFFGMMPLIVVKFLVTKWSKATDKRMKKVISVLMFFGGGVLLATCFLHMMPEVRDSFKTAEPELELPLSEIIFLAGFFLVYMIEDVVHSIVHKRRSNKEARNANLGNSNSNSNEMQLREGKGNQNQNQNQVLSSGTSALMIGDKGLGLHNDEAIINAARMSHIQSHTHSNGNPNANGNIAINGPKVVNGTTPALSLSADERINIGPNHLRETREIFRKNSSEEIPGVPKGRVGGIVNAAFVAEKFQYCDPDWLKDITNGGSNPNTLNRNHGHSHGKTSEADCYPNCPNMNNVNDAIHPDHASQLNNNNIKSSNGNGKGFNFLQVPQFLRRNSDRSSTRSNSSRISKSSQGHMHLPMDGNVDDSIGGEIRNILIVIAISFHGIFEGMAIGLQSSENDVWYLFLAVSLHECTILFCIGVELISSKTKVFRMVLYILVVSLVSPVGIAIGIIITERAYGGAIHQALIIGLFQGLAAGTLLYVTFFEIFQEEGKKLHRKCYHILVAVLGFILMGSLEFMGGHNHGGDSHSHDHDHNHGSTLNLTNATTAGPLDDHDHAGHSHDHEDHSGHNHSH